MSDNRVSLLSSDVLFVNTSDENLFFEWDFDNGVIDSENKDILKFIYKIYEKDSKFKKLCKNKLLEKKSKSLECKINIIRIIDININNPTFTEKNSCHEIINFKKNIRYHYIKYTKDFNNIIHGCDNVIDSNNVRDIIKILIPS